MATISRMAITPSNDSATEPRVRFLELLGASLREQSLVRLVLAKYRGSEPDLVRLQARPVEIKGMPCLSLVKRFRTRDLTTNLPVAQAPERIDELLASGFRQAHLVTRGEEVQLSFSKRGKSLLRTAERIVADSAGGAGGDGNAGASTSVDLAHNREKQRLLSLERPFLHALGVTDQQRQLVPAMSRKWKQINRFIEVFADAWQPSGQDAAHGPLRVMDFGSGKGYLTFALHDYLGNTLGLDVQMTGIELRPDLVQASNTVVAALGIKGLAFSEGDIASHSSHTWGSGASASDLPSSCEFDVMIALHACDTATDDAIHRGIRAGASVIMCAPCCHKQLRPQLLSPHPLRPILQHGIHLGQEAEMLTDGLRALLLEASGYDTRVFEFISLEHTSKNKMILATRRAVARPAEPVLAQIREIKAFYGIREQRLESLLLEDQQIAEKAFAQ